MHTQTETRGAVDYYVDDNGNTVSEGYHDLYGDTGRRGAARYDVKCIPDPTRDTWEETGRIGTGDRVGYDGVYWYLLDDANTPNSEPYEYIWVDDQGDICGKRNGGRQRVSKITRTKPEILPDGTELQHTSGATYSLADDSASGHTIFIHDGAIKTQRGASISRVRQTEPVTSPCAPPAQETQSTTTTESTVSTDTLLQTLESIIPSPPTLRTSVPSVERASEGGASGTESSSSSPPTGSEEAIEYWKTQYVRGNISITTFEQKIDPEVDELVPDFDTPPLDGLETPTSKEPVKELA